MSEMTNPKDFATCGACGVKSVEAHPHECRCMCHAQDAKRAIGSPMTNPLPLTPAALAALKALHEKAFAAAPGEARIDACHLGGYGITCAGQLKIGVFHFPDIDGDEAVFYAALRNAFPSLVATIEQQARALEIAVEQLKNSDCSCASELGDEHFDDCSATEADKALARIAAITGESK